MAKEKPKYRPLFRVYQQRHDGDCAVAALAMLLNLSYEEVLVVAARIAPKVLVRGLYSVEIQLISEEFGRSLEKTLKPDLDEDTGVLVVQYPNKDEHAVFVTNGLVFEPTGDDGVWDAGDYLRAYKARVLHLLKEED